MWTLIDIGSKMNTIQPSIDKQLGFRIWETDVNAQKIDDSCLKIFDMAIATVQMENETRRFWYFEKIFQLADINMSIALGIYFLLWAI